MLVGAGEEAQEIRLPGEPGVAQDLVRLEHQFRGPGVSSPVVAVPTLDGECACHHAGLLRAIGRGQDLLHELQSAGMTVLGIDPGQQPLDLETGGGFLREPQGRLQFLGGAGQVSSRVPGRARGTMKTGQFLPGLAETLGAFVGSLVAFHRLVHGEHLLRIAGRLQSELLALGEFPPLDEVVGQILDLHPGGLRPQLLQPAGHADVEPAAADGVQLLVEHLADLVVGEHERVGPRGVHQLGGGRRVEGVEDCVLPLGGDRHQFLEPEALAQDRGTAEHARDLLAHPIETMAYGGLHPLGNGELVELLAPPLAVLAVDGALLDEGLHHLLDEERVPLGLAEDRLAELLAHLVLVEEGGDLVAGLVPGEPAEGDARGEALAVPVHQRRGKGMRAVEIGLAVGGEEQHPLVAQVPEKIVEQTQGPLVRPLQVVEEHHQPLALGHRGQEPGHVVEQPEPLLVGGKRRRLGERSEARAEFGSEAGELRRGLAGDLQGRVVRRTHPATERLGEGEIGGGRLVLVAAALQHQRTLHPGVHRDLAGETGLARTGLAGDERQVGAALPRPVPEAAEFLEGFLAPHEATAGELLEKQYDVAGRLTGGGIAGDPFQGTHHVARLRVATVGFLGQQPEHHALQLRGEIGAVGAGRQDRRVHVLGDHGEGVVPGEGATTGEELVEHDSHRVEIGARIHRAAERLLRRHVGGGPGEEPLPGHARSRRRNRQAEIGDLHPRPLGGVEEQQVFRLEVAMDQPVGVGMGEGVEHLTHEVQGPVHVVGHVVAEVRPLDQFHDHVGAVLMLPRVVHGHDPRVVERRRRPRLGEEAIAALLVDAIGGEHLHRHVPIEGRVPGTEHHPHAPAADLVAQAIATGEHVTGPEPGEPGQVVGGKALGDVVGAVHGRQP